MPLLKVLGEMLPGGLVAVKGFALTDLMASSKEQDVLIVDRNVAGAILPGGSLHFPIEACLASIQIKSRLTRSTIRDATINCVSLKSLGMFADKAPWNSKNHGICFGVFAYRTDYTLEKAGRCCERRIGICRARSLAKPLLCSWGGYAYPGG